MAYYTYFEGTLNFQLGAEHLTELKNKIEKYFGIEGYFEAAEFSGYNPCPIQLSENTLKVNGEWNDRGFMEVLTLYIETNGQLLSGNIKCYGETASDMWEIIVEKNQAYIREIGTSVTYHRAKPKLKLFVAA